MDHVADAVVRELGIVTAQQAVGSRADAEQGCGQVRGEDPLSHSPTDQAGELAVFVASRLRVIRFERRPRCSSGRGQRQQAFGEVVDMNDRGAPLRWNRHHAELGRPEQLEHVLVARAVNGGRAHDGEVQPARLDKGLCIGLGRAVERQRRLTRGQRTGEDEALGARRLGRVQQFARAGDIGLFEFRRVGRVRKARDMDYAVGILAEGCERFRIREAALDPGDAMARCLRTAGKSADGDALPCSRVENGLPDKSRGSRKRKGHARTM